MRLVLGIRYTKAGPPTISFIIIIAIPRTIKLIWPLISAPRNLAVSTTNRKLITATTAFTENVAKSVFFILGGAQKFLHFMT